MQPNISSWLFTFSFTFFFFFFLGFSSSSSSYTSSSLPLINSNTTAEFRNHTAISEFRILNRKSLGNCPDPNRYLQINVSSKSKLSDDQYVTVTVTGVLLPAASDWVAMISPAHSE